ncbi:MAG: ATP-binding protein [Steroidobacteraceae bacterium]
MSMSIPELERALRALRLSGMTATLQPRALQVAQGEMDFIEAFSWLVQDELDRRRSRLLDRRFALSGLPERKDLKDFDWNYNPKVPKRDILELATMKFIDEREGALFIGSPGLGKSYIAKALAQLAVQRGYTVFYREAHVLMEEINEARELGEIRKYRAQMNSAELLVLDDLFLRKLPSNAGDEIADVLMSRYEKLSTIITSNRVVEDWPKLLGEPKAAEDLQTGTGHDCGYDNRAHSPTVWKEAIFAVGAMWSRKGLYFCCVAGWPQTPRTAIRN